VRQCVTNRRFEFFHAARIQICGLHHSLRSSDKGDDIVASHLLACLRDFLPPLGLQVLPHHVPGLTNNGGARGAMLLFNEVDIYIEVAAGAVGLANLTEGAEEFAPFWWWPGVQQ